MCFCRGFDAELISQVVNTTLIYRTDFSHIPARTVGKQQSTISRLRGVAKSKPAFALFLDGCPAFNLHELFDKLLHFGFKNGLNLFAFENNPVIIKTGQEFTLIPVSYTHL